MLAIEYLNTTGDIKQIAQWQFDEWGYLWGVNNSLEATEERIRTTYLDSSKIPFMLVAKNDGHVQGSISLVRCGMWIREHLTPWVDSLYVSDAAREQGIGEELLNSLLAKVKVLGYDKVYLYTVDKVAYYEKRNWQILERVIYKNQDATVMVYYV